MRINFEKVSPDTETSFRCLEWDEPNFDCPYHYHPEIEITEILTSEGERLVGDRFDTFSPGDLAMFGSHLPHRYKNFQRGRCRSRVVQFHPDAWGTAFFDCPEMRVVNRLFQRAERGLLFSETTRKRARPKLAQMFQVKQGSPRLRLLFELLELLSEDLAARPMASRGFVRSKNSDPKRRLQRVLDYIDDHWTDRLQLEEVAHVANLHPQSLSRYFRQHLRKSFQAYLIELRLSRAARELLITNRTVTDIAFSSGFNNLAHFNRQFRKIYQRTPSEYRDHEH